MPGAVGITRGSFWDGLGVGSPALALLDARALAARASGTDLASGGGPGIGSQGIGREIFWDGLGVGSPALALWMLGHWPRELLGRTWRRVAALALGARAWVVGGGCGGPGIGSQGRGCGWWVWRPWHWEPGSGASPRGGLL